MKQSSLTALISLIFSLYSIAGDIVIHGSVKDKETGDLIPGVNIAVKGTIAGTVTDAQGRFLLKIRSGLPITLNVSIVGYKSQEIIILESDQPVEIMLVPGTLLSEEIVVTASRIEESIMKSPVAIEKMDTRSIKETSSPGFYDAMGNLKGVQMITSSLTFKVPNTRGFNIPNNFRFMQLTDGVDMQAATLGVPLGNAIGPTELDMASVEVTPGAASALYGMNALNGMANLITKNPFEYQGLSVYFKTGINHVDGIDHNPSILSESAIRYAQAFNNRFAFKLNLGYMEGVDWRSNTRLDQNPNNLKSANPGFPALDANNAAFDGWNKYGDDALAGSNVVSIGGLNIDGKANQTLRVARTGYWEIDLVSPKVSNLKFDAALRYRINDKVEISYTYRVGTMDGVFQRGNKVRLQGVVVQNHSMEIKGVNFIVKNYVSIEDTGGSYNVKPLADNMDLYSGGATDTRTAASWGTKYKNALNAYAASHGGSLNSSNLADATQYARDQADASRVKPGSYAFDSLKNVITGINNWDIRSSAIPNAPVTGGAALVQRSRMYHTEAQWDLSKHLKVIDFLIGGDARLYEVLPDGNNFVDFSRPMSERNLVQADGTFGNNVYYKKIGGFIQATKTVFDSKLKLFGSLRTDYNPEFDPKITPRFAAVYSPTKSQSVRFTFQEGYRFPSLFEAMSFVNNGRVRRVGSLPYINEGLGYLDNSYTQASVIDFNAAVSSQGNTDAAALANRNLLVVANLPKADAEKITSFEIGYKAILLNNAMSIDIDAYTNTYSGFLGQVQVYVPIGTTVGADDGVIAMLDRNRDATTASGGNSASQGQDRYRVYTNAKNLYRNYGSSLGLTYNFYKKYIVSGNVNYNQMVANQTNDVFVTGFNTPPWATTFVFGNREVIKNIGFQIAWKWQDTFLWESPLVTGKVPAFQTVDAQATFRIPNLRSSIKFGGSNILNQRYIQYAGGPTIGALYYVSVTLDGLLQK